MPNLFYKNFFVISLVTPVALVLGLFIFGFYIYDGNVEPKKVKTTETFNIKATPTATITVMPTIENLRDIGVPIRMDNLEITIIGISERCRVGKDFAYITPSKNMTYICVQYDLKNLTSKSINNNIKVVLVDSNKAIYERNLIASNRYDIELDNKSASTLYPSITKKDSCVFEISKDGYNVNKWKLIIKNNNKEEYLKIK